MNRLESIKNITTLEQGVRFLQEYNFGGAIEDIDICTGCIDREIPSCSAKPSCKVKLLEGWLLQEI